MNNKQSEFLEITKADDTTFFDVTSGLPVKNRKLKADNLVSSDPLEESKYKAASTFLVKEVKAELEQLVAENVGKDNEHLADFNNPHQVTKEQLGLSEVDNTSDINKPISTEQQVALNNKINLNGLNSNIDKLYFNPSTLSALTSIGDVRFSPDSKTLEVKVSDTVSIQLGQEMQTRVKNNAGVQINNGALVYIDSAVGANPLAKLATTANGDIAQRTYGMATEDIASNGFGAITTEGLVNGLNTSAFADGSMLYLSTNGTFTATEPVAPTPKISVGMVLRSHQNQGVVYVKIRAIARNQKLSDVYAPTITGGDVLRWNSSTLRFETFNVTSALGLKTDKATQVIAGSGLTGGGTLEADRTINVGATDDSIVIAADGIKADTQNSLTSTSVTKPLAANQGKVLNDNLVQLGANFNTSVADEKAMFPAIAYNKRVLADGGTVISKQSVIDGYKTMIDLLPNTKLLFCPQAGVKTRVSGIYSYLTKAYDMGVNGVDLTQTTDASQPFLSGGIAPNEKGCLKVNLNSVSKTLSYSTISFASADSWSIVLAIKQNRNAGGRTLELSDYSYIGSWLTATVLNNGSVNLLASTSILEVGKINIVELKYSNGTGLIKINGKPVITNVLVGNISLTRLRTDMVNSDLGIYYYQVFDKYLSESESTNVYSYLRSQYPEIESVAIGNQMWATSNYEGVVTGNGTVIPEVQSASTSVAPELNLNPFFETDTLGYSLTGGNTYSRETDGSTYFLRVTSSLSSTNNLGVLLPPTNIIYNKWYKIKFKAKSINETSKVISVGDQNVILTPDKTTIISNPNLTTSWQDYEFNAYITTSSIRLYFAITTVGNSVDLDNISIKEVGWADLTTPAWCYYNNDPALGSVYGKLYNYYAVQEIAKNPPKGWRVPSSADFVQLSTFLGGNSIAGGKLKKEGFVYWVSPNTGATNESGLSILGTGYRDNSVGFSGSLYETTIHTLDGYRLYLQKESSGFSLGVSDPKVGRSIRLIRNSPVGDQIQNISTGVFTTNIAAGTANKDLSIPFGYEVKAINVLATTAITNFKCDLYSTSGVLQQNLVTGKSASANVPIKFGVSADANIQYTDPILRFNCTGNSGSGMEIQVILNKIL